MPELPEVETVCNGIRPVLQGHSIASVTLNRPDLRFPLPLNLQSILTHNTVTSVNRRAKYIIISLESGHIWITHLGMTGKFIINPDTTDKHDHVIIKTTNGDTLVYNDPRRFGYMDLRGENDPCKHTDTLGPEPLGNHFSGTVLYENLKSRKLPLKTALLNQAVVAGLGNIYVCEALWECALHPEKKSNTITKNQASTLYTAIVETLNRAIASGGSSLRDYRQADGSLGYFQHNWRAYGKENEPCNHSDKCKGTITRITQSGRSTFFCPKHQKK